MRLCTVEGCGRKHAAKGLCSKHYKQGWTSPTTCSVDGCSRPVAGRSLCSTHYAQWQQGAPLEAPLAAPAGPRVCAADGCERTDVEARGLCRLHYKRWLARPDHDISDPAPPSGLTKNEWAREYRRRPPEKKRPRGERSPQWKGVDVSYEGAHARVRQRRGRASIHPCVDCGGPAREWSYDHADPDERTELKTIKGGWTKLVAYSVKVEHYHPRCSRCHGIFDSPFV